MTTVSHFDNNNNDNNYIEYESKGDKEKKFYQLINYRIS